MLWQPTSKILHKTLRCVVQWPRHQLHKWPFVKYPNEYTQTCTGCFEKSSPLPKTFWNIFSLVKSFCMKFCKFVGSLYPQISGNFCRFILIFLAFTLSGFQYSPRKWKCSEPAFWKCHFSSCVSVCANCKHSIIVLIFTTNVLVTLL